MPEPGPPPRARLVEPPAAGAAGAAKPHREISRGWLYFLALVALGALVVPIALEHRGISRRERIFIIALGCLQTLAAVVAAVAFAVWMVGWMKGQLAS